MAHIPHLFLPGPWSDSTIRPGDAQARHLNQVLRLTAGSQISYTDGAGELGSGVWSGSGVERGEEHSIERSRVLRMAVCPPKPKERQRFLVEKLGELGVSELIWMRSAYSEGRPSPKAHSWAVGALEQSRGAFLMTVSGPVSCDTIGGWVGDPDGDSLREMGSGSNVLPTLMIGPEGGFSVEEIANSTGRFGLGATILRTETAAIVAAGLCLT